MRYIGIIILLVLCLTLLLFTGSMINTVKPEPASGNLENQEDINQSSNNFQSSSTGPIYEPGTEEEDTEELGTVYPQKWATGDGTVENPWANDCIKKALDFAPAGGTIFLKTGYYILSDVIIIDKKINIIGEGRDHTIIKTANEFGFEINKIDYVSIKNLTIDGDAQTDGQQYLTCILIAGSDYVSLEDIEVKNAGYYGINLYQDNHLLCQNIYAHDNYRHGLHPGSDTAGRNKYNTYRDIYAWDNGINGFDDRGISIDPTEETNNVFDNIHCWDNGEYGIAMTEQSGVILSNSTVSGNGKSGMWLSTLHNFNISNCSATLNNELGIYLRNSKNVNLTNVIVKNNNISDTDYIGGTKIENSSGIKFTSCQSYDDRDTPLQLYGIELYGTNTGISLLNCKLTPNKEGEIYNPAGVVLTIITETSKSSKIP